MGIIDFSSDEFTDTDKKISYCKHCLEYNLKVPLKNRIYPKGEPIPSDNDLFLQCHNCGLIVPVYELEKESELKDVVETIESPFDISKNQFLGLDSRKARKKARENKDRFGDIQDKELLAELKSGSTLISYSED